MRLFFNFLIIIFVLISVYVVRNDILVAYNKAVYYTHHYEVSNKYPFVKTKGSIETVDTNSEINKNTTSEKTFLSQTPGPLKVLDDVLSINDSNLDLEGIIKWTNRNRADNGLPPLVENSTLDKSASIKVKDMFDKQYFEHVSPSGVGVSDLGGSVGYEYIVIGENLALGNFKNNESLLNAWMNSPGHRANILNNRYTEIGVGVARGIYNGKEVWLAVQHFGLPKSACPSIDEVLKGKIEILKNQASIMEKDLKGRKAIIDSEVVYDGLSHNEQIDEYNKMVQKYNSLITNIKNYISTYNDSVRSFNKCALGE